MRACWCKQVVAALRGDIDLPWEGPLREEVVMKLGVLRETVRAMLHRTASLRPSMQTVHSSIMNM
jgi:hypothetical protein